MQLGFRLGRTTPRPQNTIEIDALVGAVIELGRLTQTPTPHIDAVYACVKLLAKTLGEEKGKLKVEKIG